MTFQELKELYERCTAGNCTPEEQKLFEEYCDGFDLSDIPWAPQFGDRDAIEKKLREDLQNRLRDNKVKPIKRFYWGVAAAIIVLVGGVLVSINYLSVNKDATHHLAAGKNIINHGIDKAILILSDGRQIALDNSQKGTLFSQNHILVDKDEAASVTYKKDGTKSFGAAKIFNTMVTPRGGKYELVLSDGTKVWLNAASSIRYPVYFSGNERIVELSGEAYFEVAHNKAKPFKVLSKGQVVQVLGTHFNINAYADEDAIRTTLLSGSVKVFGSVSSSASQKNGLVIKPDEQATFKNNQLSKSVVDADDVIAWKNGFIVFKNADIKSVMRQIARWYDVEVTYQGQPSDDTYSGEISRNADLDEVIKALKLNDINLKVSQRTIIVSL
ncbi:FecR family protein [Mucilaginibacter lacusdianchii]|uniref:FecR family protein n=1 Tax=Mucilaginibacter lacusdianchii TaxID=2684211 RepID=UPI00131E19B3|nr:FecR family protein [Mucilaginibacter sp. JXJ CY 39]